MRDTFIRHTVGRLSLFCVVLAAVALSAVATGPAASQTAEAGIKPNIVFILFDDMGLSAPVCYGNRFYETPNIDRLSVEGCKFIRANADRPFYLA